MTAGQPAAKVLTIDIGGSNIKLKTNVADEIRKIPSGPDLTPSTMVDAVKTVAADMEHDVITIGYPGPVLNNMVHIDPHNLGAGWVGYDFAAAFGKPYKLVNDALMQAIGCYDGGRMLFLGLGTGLGAAMILEHVAQPMELAHLPYRKGMSFEDYVGEAGRKRVGSKEWRDHVFDVVARLSAALIPDYIVIGGGNVKKLEELPPKCRRGSNASAFEGGFRLWGEDKFLL